MGFAVRARAVADRSAHVFFLREFFDGMRIAFKNMVEPKYTINYPMEKGPLSPRFRGEHALRRYPSGEERCAAALPARPACAALM